MDHKVYSELPFHERNIGELTASAANILRSLDWRKIVKCGTINAIDWKFNSPTAAWWGGWRERLIRIIKDLLKRVLGKAYISHEEMMTVLCDCEAIINSRPLTYI
ncbi:hypothetical protein AVEN_84252-1 [Araneus ventricosus]|uniref:Uncharacterized protein n=1 Tax=Araneus ventricosus TaxID=182803 RepID=A0A4Y2J1A0_ARAVE|nr:hypothetical protein AVEN_84252-1 [Araneus ventricosus]